jgi:hypothetical protein
MDKETLTDVLAKHQLWRNGEPGGVRADLTRADLTRANLTRANLAWANLTGANLAWANLTGADLQTRDGQRLTLTGRRPFLSIGPIGSRDGILMLFYTDRGIYVRAGCFWGSLDAFADAVQDTHGDSEHGRDYRAAIVLAQTVLG